MKSFIQLMVENNDSSENEDVKKFFTILEILIVAFLVSLIPELIAIGKPPTLEQLYTPILTGILMALYAYIRIRNIDLEDE